MVPDDRIVVDHYQDHGILWAILNGFHGARSSYGYHGIGKSLADRLRHARKAIVHWPRQMFADAHEAVGTAKGRRRELAVVALIGSAVGIGGALGLLTGPGRSPDRVA